jgi:capsular polysaccharide biosynthesis protein
MNHGPVKEALGDIAYRIRRWPAVHRPGSWLRRVLWASLKDAAWVFVRGVCAGSQRFGAPARTVSVYQTLRSGWPKLNGRIVLHDQGTPQVTEDSLLVRSNMEQHREQPWPVFWSEHAGARLVAESLACLTPEKSLVLESAYGEKRWRDDPAARFLTLPPATKLAGNWTSLVSRWVPNNPRIPIYGHWLHDALPRLALLKEFPADTKILVPPNLGRAHKESLQLLGVWDRCRPTPERHLEIERYFFSSPVSMIDCYNPYALKWTREALLPKRDAAYSGPKKFFLQRTSKRRPVENMDAVCDFFRSQGWAVVKDMDLTFAETIKLFSEAEAVCSVLGSNMSNVIFCPPGCLVMHLVPDIFLDGWIDWIAQANELNYHAQVFPTGGPASHRNFIDLELLRQFFDSVTAAPTKK